MRWLPREINVNVLFCSVHSSAPEKFENAALFLRLGLPSTLIRHENGARQKRFSNRSDLKTPVFYFRVDGKAFQKRWRRDNPVISLIFDAFSE